MTPANNQKLVQDWITYHYLPDEEQKSSSCFWAINKLHHFVREEPDVAWTIVEEIRRLDSSDLILSNLAAGPWEDLFVLHGEQFIGRVEALAAQDLVFRKMLGAVWRNKISDSVWRRLKAVAGPSF